MKEKLPSGFFVRKVGNFSLYPDGANRPFNTVGKLPADILASSLTTTENTLSWWHITDINDDEISLVAALFLSAYREQSYGTMRLAIFPSSYVVGRLSMLNTPEKGETALKGEAKRHFDSQNMDINAILWVAKQISLAKTGVHQQVVILPFKSKDIIEYLKNHKDDITISHLAPWLRAKIS